MDNYFIFLKSGKMSYFNMGDELNNLFKFYAPNSFFNNVWK
jgi:hypothetical protein